MTDHSPPHDGHDHSAFGHPVPVKLLLAVFVALIVLTMMTLFLAGHLGPFGFVVALFLATVKATLVMLFFMHMFWDRGFNIMAFLSSLFFVALFIGMTLLDSKAYQNTIDEFPRAPEQSAPAEP